MEAIAHSPSFAKKAGVPQSVGKDFSNADKGRKFSKGGDMKSMKPAMPAKMAKGGSAMSPKMGAVKTAAPSRDGIASKGKTKGTMIVMKGDKGLK